MVSVPLAAAAALASMVIPFTLLFASSCIRLPCPAAPALVKHIKVLVNTILHVPLQPATCNGATLPQTLIVPDMQPTLVDRHGDWNCLPITQQGSRISFACVVCTYTQISLDADMYSL